MSKKEEKAKEYALSIAETDKEWGRKPNNYESNIIVNAFESGWHAAMEYLYRRPLDVIVEDVIKEMEGE